MKIMTDMTMNFVNSFFLSWDFSHFFFRNIFKVETTHNLSYYYSEV